MKYIRVVPSAIVAKRYVTKQLEADTAFLNNDLKKQVYMEVMTAIFSAANLMFKLNKAIYGLKQATSAWSKTNHAVFVRIGFRSSGAD